MIPTLVIIGAPHIPGKGLERHLISLYQPKSSLKEVLTVATPQLEFSPRDRQSQTLRDLKLPIIPSCVLESTRVMILTMAIASSCGASIIEVVSPP